MISVQQHTARETRADFRADALANVAWVMLLCGVQGFALVLARRLGATTLMLSAGTAMGYLPGLLTCILSPLCRHLSLGSVTILLRVLSGASLLICLLQPTLLGLAIGFSLMTIVGGLVEASYPVLVSQIYRPALQSRAMSLIYTARALAGFVWLVFLARLMSDGDSAHCIRILGLMGGLGVISAAAHWRFRSIREEIAQPEQTRVDNHPLKNREFMYYMTSLTVFGSGWLFAMFITPILQVNIFKLNNGQVGMLAAVNILVQMLAYLYFSRFGVIRPCNRLLAIPYVLLGIPIFTYSVLLLFHQFPPFHPAPFWVLLVANGLGGIGVGLQAMYFYLVVNALAGGASRLRYQTFQATVNGGRGIIFPFIAGLVYAKFGLLPCVLTATVLIMLSGALANVLTTDKLS